MTSLHPPSFHRNYFSTCIPTVEPPNNGHVGDEHSVHWSEVVPSSEVEMYGQYIGRGVNSVSNVERLSTLQSVHYRRGLG